MERPESLIAVRLEIMKEFLKVEGFPELDINDQLKILKAFGDYVINGRTLKVKPTVRSRDDEDEE